MSKSTSSWLLRKDQRSDFATLIKRVVEGYRFLGNLTEIETQLANDKAGKAQAQADQLTRSLKTNISPGQSIIGV